MKKLFAAIAVVPLLGLATAAMAAEPMQLTNSQMDKVTAGSASGALVLLSAMASGTSNALTDTSGGATIVQSPVVFMTPLGNVTLFSGAVLTAGSSTSSN